MFVGFWRRRFRELRQESREIFCSLTNVQRADGNDVDRHAGSIHPTMPRGKVFPENSGNSSVPFLDPSQTDPTTKVYHGSFRKLLKLLPEATIESRHPRVEARNSRGVNGDLAIEPKLV